MIAAAAVAMMVVSVAAANPDGVQEFFYNIASYVQVDKYRTEMTTADGEQMTLMTVPQARVENRDGRAVLVMDGCDVADITDALAQEQHYAYEETGEGSKIVLTVNGTIDQWSLKVDVGTLEEDGTYDWFGGVTVTSEDEEVAGGEFGRYNDSDVGSFIVSSDDLKEADGEVTVGIYVTENEIPQR